MNKIISVNEYKGTFLEECYISKSKKSEITPDTILSQLNSNLEKGLITEELHGKAVIQLNSLIEKGKKEMIGKITVGKNGKKYKKVAEGKWLEVSEHGMTKEEHQNKAYLHKIGSTQENIHSNEYRKLSDKEHADEEVGVKEDSKSKHISDISKEEKHSMAEKMGISGHKEMTEKELSKQLIDRKIDSELKGKGSVKELNNNFNIIQKELREKGRSENFQIYSSVEKENNLKNILKTPKGKEFIKLLKDIPLGVKISHPRWANKYIRNEKGFLDKFSNKTLSINKFALNRISDNNTTYSEMKFEEPIKKSFEDSINILKGEQLDIQTL